MMTFKAKFPSDGNVQLSDETTEWKWININEIDLNEVGNEDVKKALTEFIKLNS